MSGWGEGWGETPWGGDVYSVSGAVPTITISGTARPYLVVQSATISKPKRGRASASFSLFDFAQSYRPVVGEPVVLTDGGTTFRGLITKVRGAREQGIMQYVRYFCECADYAAVFDRRFVSRTYPALSLVSNIYADVLQNFLIDEGFNVDGVNGFAAIASELKFDYRSVTEVFDTIADLAGEDWWVGGPSGKTIYSRSLAEAPLAPFSITEGSGNWRSLEVTRDSRSYRNRQHVRAAVPLQTGAITESHTGNGIQWFFATQFVLNEAPTVTVGGVAQAVYEMGVDAYPAAGWFWIRGGGGVQQGQQTPPGVGVAVVVTYGSYESNVVTAESTAQQTARAAIEGGAGIWESIEDARDIDNVDLAQDFAQALLDRYAEDDSGEMPVEMRYETDEPQLEPGMAQEVYLPLDGVQAGGAEKVANGTFDDDSGWTLIGTLVIDGKLSIPGVGTAGRDCGIEAGKTYRISFVMTEYGFGNCVVQLGGTTLSGSFSGDGTHTEDIYVATISSGDVVIGGDVLSCKIDDLSVKELGAQTLHITQVESRDAAGKPFSNGFYFRHRVTLSSVRDQTGWLSWWMNFYRSTKVGGGSANEAAALLYDK